MKDTHFLEKKSIELRRLVFDMCVLSGGHLASSLSCVDILVSLFYGNYIVFDSKKPDWFKRDKFILSKGHAETILYAVLSDLGYFPKKWLFEKYRRGDCKLGGHPDYKLPGVEITSGALGHGLGIAAGISVANQMDNCESTFTFVLMGDAECSEGSVWEAAMFSAQKKLNKLICIIDRNGIGSLDYTQNYISLEPLAGKWNAFGWETLEIDGHDFEQLHNSFNYARTRQDSRPLAVIAKTVKGKGVSFMENNPIWHVKQMDQSLDIEDAKKELWKGNLS